MVRERFVLIAPLRPGNRNLGDRPILSEGGREKVEKRKLVLFDAARYLTDDAAIAEYITAVLEFDDPDLLLAHP